MVFLWSDATLNNVDPDETAHYYNGTSSAVFPGKSNPKGLRSLGSNPRPLVYKASSFNTTPRRHRTGTPSLESSVGAQTALILSQ